MGVDDALRLAHIHENNRLTTTSHYVLLCASYFYNDTNYNRYRLYLHSCLYLLSKFNSHFHLLTGFVADKIGNYKLLLVFSILLGGFIYAPIPWLLNDFDVLSDEAFRNGISNATIQNETFRNMITPFRFFSSFVFSDLFRETQQIRKNNFTFLQ